MATKPWEPSKTNIHRFFGISKDAVESAYTKIAAELTIRLKNDECVVIGPNGAKKFALTAKEKTMDSRVIIPAGTLIYRGCDAVPSGPPPAIVESNNELEHSYIKKIFLASRVSPPHIALLLCDKRKGHSIYGTPISKWADTVSRWRSLSEEHKKEAYDFALAEIKEYIETGTSTVHRIIGADSRNDVKMRTYSNAIEENRGSQSMLAQVSQKHPSVVSKMAGAVRESGVACQKEVISGLKSLLIDSKDDIMQRNIKRFAEKWGVQQEMVNFYVERAIADYAVLDDDDNFMFDDKGNPLLSCTWDFLFDAMLVRYVALENPSLKERIDSVVLQQKNITAKGISRIAKSLWGVPDHATLISFLIDLIKSERRSGAMSDEQVAICFSQVLLEHFDAMVIVIRSKIAETISSVKISAADDLSVREIVCKSIDSVFTTFRIESMRKESIYNAYLHVIENDDICKKEAQDIIGSVIKDSLLGNDQIVQLLLEHIDEEDLRTFSKHAGVYVHRNSVISSMFKKPIDDQQAALVVDGVVAVARPRKRLPLVPVSEFVPPVAKKNKPIKREHKAALDDCFGKVFATLTSDPA